MKQHKIRFQQAFAYLYYLMLSADNVADIKELKLGKKIINIEKLDYQDVMNQMDQLTKVPRNQIFSEAVDLIKGIAKKEQVKCLAYIQLIAKIDGSYDEREKELLDQISISELNISLQEISDVEKELNKVIAKIDS